MVFAGTMAIITSIALAATPVHPPNKGTRWALYCKCAFIRLGPFTVQTRRKPSRTIQNRNVAEADRSHYSRSDCPFCDICWHYVDLC